MGNDEHAREDTVNMLNYNHINTSTENQYVTFRIGEEEYGIDIMLVQEIIRYNKPTTVFNANPVIRGVNNFRGKVIPIIDMHRKFNLSETDYDNFTVVIVIEVNNKTMGMIVDRVSDIMNFAPEEIQMIDREFAEDIKTEHIKGMAKSRDRIIMLLDSERVLSFEEFKLAQETVSGGEKIK